MSLYSFVRYAIVILRIKLKTVIISLKIEIATYKNTENNIKDAIINITLSTISPLFLFIVLIPLYHKLTLKVKRKVLLNYI